MAPASLSQTSSAYLVRGNTSYPAALSKSNRSYSLEHGVLLEEQAKTPDISGWSPAKCKETTFERPMRRRRNPFAWIQVFDSFLSPSLVKASCHASPSTEFQHRSMSGRPAILDIDVNPLRSKRG